MLSTASFNEVKKLIDMINSIENNKDVDKVFHYFSTHDKFHNSQYHITQLLHIIDTCFKRNYKKEKLYLRLNMKFMELYPYFATETLIHSMFPGNCRFDIIYPDSVQPIGYYDEFTLENLPIGTIINISIDDMKAIDNDDIASIKDDNDDNSNSSHAYDKPTNNNSNDTNNNTNSKPTNSKPTNSKPTNNINNDTNNNANNNIIICSLTIIDNDADICYRWHRTCNKFEVIKHWKQNFNIVDTFNLLHSITFTNIDNAVDLIGFYEKANNGVRSLNEIEIAIKNDDVDRLQELTSTFDYEKFTSKNYVCDVPINSLSTCCNYENNAMIELSMMYGSIKCFKYLFLNKCYQTSVFNLQYTLIGKNLEIFHIIENNDDKLKLETRFSDIVRYGDLDIFIYWITRYKLTKVMNILEYSLSNYRYDIIDYLLNNEIIDVNNMCLTNDKQEEYYISPISLRSKFEAVMLLMRSFEYYSLNAIEYITTLSHLHYAVSKGFLSWYDGYNHMISDEYSIRFHLILDFISYHKPADMIKYIANIFTNDYIKEEDNKRKHNNNNSKPTNKLTNKSTNTITNDANTIANNSIANNSITNNNKFTYDERIYVIGELLSSYHNKKDIIELLKFFNVKEIIEKKIKFTFGPDEYPLLYYYFKYSTFDKTDEKITEYLLSIGANPNEYVKNKGTPTTYIYNKSLIVNNNDKYNRILNLLTRYGGKYQRRHKYFTFILDYNN